MIALRKKMIKFADVIVDLQQGDCGKGAVSNDLVKNNDYTHVVRYNGSNNAGHSIVIRNKKIITHSVPSGVLHGVKSIIGFGCVLNVDHFFKELQDIKNAGINTSDLIKIAKNTHIITANHLDEDQSDKKIGTTKRGNGPAYRDKYDRKGTRAFEIDELSPYLIDIYEEFYNEKECKILFEGAQGFYLDIDWGDYPYVTSSHCTVGSAVLNGVPPQKIRKVFGVAKIYETYVGAKKFEPEDDIFNKIRELGGEYGSTTGRPRQCDYLNLNNLIKAIRVNGVTDLVIRKVDILRELNIFRLYHNDKIIKFETEVQMKNYIFDHVKDNIINLYLAYNPNDLGEKQ
jgi:adenylosuccinate synthase